MKDINEEHFIKVCNESISMSKAAATLDMHWNTFRKYAISFNCFKPNQGGRGTHNSKKRKDSFNTQDILDGKHPQYQTRKLKERLYEENILKEECSECGISNMYNGKPITLELDHIDGQRTNHSLNNLRILCPNCHSQTETFRFKNKKH